MSIPVPRFKNYLPALPPNMQTCFRRSELELRGPRSGLNMFTLQGFVRGVQRNFCSLNSMVTMRQAGVRAEGAFCG
eukprot:9422789-Alexandrium_andersonii.AAC.1